MLGDRGIQVYVARLRQLYNGVQTELKPVNCELQVWSSINSATTAQTAESSNVRQQAMVLCDNREWAMCSSKPVSDMLVP